MPGARHSPPAQCCLSTIHMGVSQNYGYLFEGPYTKDYSIWGPILMSPYFGKLPHFCVFAKCLYNAGGDGNGRWKPKVIWSHLTRNEETVPSGTRHAMLSEAHRDAVLAHNPSPYRPVLSNSSRGENLG